MLFLVIAGIFLCLVLKLPIFRLSIQEWDIILLFCKANSFASVWHLWELRTWSLWSFFHMFYQFTSNFTTEYFEFITDCTIKSFPSEAFLSMNRFAANYVLPCRFSVWKYCHARSLFGIHLPLLLHYLAYYLPKQ